MRKLHLLIILLFLIQSVNAQRNGHADKVLPALQRQYISFNPFGLLEPYAAIGLGTGKQFSKRSEYFTELSYLTRNYMYTTAGHGINGYKYLLQYRNYFYQNANDTRTVKLPHQRKYYPANVFWGAEFRYRHYGFSGNTRFINAALKDTLNDFPYRAKADVWGGGIILGTKISLGPASRWQLECTLGLGAKQKWVAFAAVPDGYEPDKIRRVDLGAPVIWESTASAYLPWAFRVQYFIH